MVREVVFVTPAPRMLRAGAVWVTIDNWFQASRRRWGLARLVTPDGDLDDEQIRQAAWGRRQNAVVLSTGQPSAVATNTKTAIKDVRSWWRMSRFDRSVRREPPRAEPLFVWQHHDLFQRAGFTIARQYNCPTVLFVDAPVVWEAYGWGVRRPGWGSLIERFGESPQFRRADLVACVSEEVAEATMARGAHRERVIVTPSTAEAVRGATPRVDIRQKLGLKGELVLGWIGSFRPFHHAEAIVQAVASLQAEHRVALLMVGNGPTLDSCRQLAARLGVRNAHFPGSVPHDQVPDYLHAMDVTVIPSGPTVEFHYSPLKLKEYLAAGRAVVAPAIGEMARLLRNGEDVLLYAPGDEREMTRSLQRLVEDANLRKKLGSQGQVTYDKLFTIDRQLDLVAERLGLPGG